jgi:hypothetical protein
MFEYYVAFNGESVLLVATLQESIHVSMLNLVLALFQDSNPSTSLQSLQSSSLQPLICLPIP